MLGSHADQDLFLPEVADARRGSDFHGEAALYLSTKNLLDELQFEHLRKAALSILMLALSQLL